MSSRARAQNCAQAAAAPAVGLGRRGKLVIWLGGGAMAAAFCFLVGLPPRSSKRNRTRAMTRKTALTPRTSSRFHIMAPAKAGTRLLRSLAVQYLLARP